MSTDTTHQLVRDDIRDRLIEDLIGPFTVDELITDRPSDRYLTGILFPRDTAIANEEADESGDDAVDPEAAASDVGVSLHNTVRPSTAGISFAIAVDDPEKPPTLRITVEAGRYRRVTVDQNQEILSDVEVEKFKADPEAARKVQTAWLRQPARVSLLGVDVPPSSSKIRLDEHGIADLELYLRSVPVRGSRNRLVTVALLNVLGRGDSRDETDENTFFQVGLQVRAGSGARLIGRRSAPRLRDEDDRIASLIYRDAEDFATGHTCAATWSIGDRDPDSWVGSAWIPTSTVPAMSPDGDEIFIPLKQHPTLRPLVASWLASADVEELVEALRMLPAAYREWLASQESRIEPLPAELRDQARRNIEVCRRAMRRMAGAVDRIARDDDVRRAFQLSAQAMQRQREWGLHDPSAELVWRPFQLGFQLLALESIADREHPERTTMDLLWFPTGGGKTEAYLGLTAFTLFHRRLTRGSAGAGTAVFMRYTLRLLTIQQFQRAAALVCACESIRREVGATELEDVPFSVGLWVGGGATPNTLKDARKSKEGDSSESTYRQIESCPACGSSVRWVWGPHLSGLDCVCGSPQCVFGSEDAPLPVYTVDELVYRKCPSLVIGTVDKFAQLARRPDAASILGVDTRCDAPDLIIQDELHLISGPLGTITGLYEIAIDDLCSRESVHPKIIGSTATIKRAPDQIRALFDRDTFQFPPPVIDASNSCFAVIDRRVPGRLYTGVTTVGRSPKFTLQAVSASLLQSADPVETAAPERDPYWTLVSYFNSLRELGGALVLMEDDVRRSIESYAVRRQEPARDLRIVEELTSRLSSSDIPRILDDLGMKITTGDAVDALLASSMISVGVDIPRLGLMVMNGQPKTVAEYIQATSRVGRGSTPGLVVGIFNNGRTRDRSKFESFRSWHDTLYRDVEATSVTPFASRARDRALHAVLVMLVRHLVSGMKENDQVKLTDARRVEVEALAERILERAERIEPAETDGARERLQELIELWSRRTDLEVYWDDYQERPTLLMSAEQHAAKVISGSGDLDAWATPNSMREVEPGVQYRLAEALRVREDHDDGEA